MKHFLLSFIKIACFAFAIFHSNFSSAQDWAQIQKILPVTRSRSLQFGFTLAFSGNYAVIGAPYGGTAYIFFKDGNVWKQVKQLQNPDPQPSDFFAGSVSISGNRVLVGAPNKDPAEPGETPIPYAGVAFLFEKDQGGKDNWGLVKKFSDPSPETQQAFGRSVFINGDSFVVGAPYSSTSVSGSDPALYAGAAYIFDNKQGVNANEWGFVQKITASERSAGANYGTAVSMDQNHIAVGAAGAGTGYILTKNTISNIWEETAKLVSSDGPGGRFGISLSLDGSNLAVGAPSVDGEQGAVYIFKQEGSNSANWPEVKKVTASVRNANQQYAEVVSISGDNLVTSAYSNATDENDSPSSTVNYSGAGYIYSRNLGGPDNWGQTKKVVASPRLYDNNFGRSVYASGNYLMIGSSNVETDENGQNPIDYSGAVYVYGDLSALPVTLATFEAEKSERAAMLRWTTAAETRTDHFDIQRSANGKEWISVGVVDAAKESNQSLHYSFTDQNPLEGENLYRLKMVDQDQSFAYSQIESLSFTETGIVFVYPNPTSAKLFFAPNAIDQISNIEILNLSGQLILQADHVTDQGISLASLNSGQYIVRVHKKDHSAVTSSISVTSGR